MKSIASAISTIELSESRSSKATLRSRRPIAPDTLTESLIGAESPRTKSLGVAGLDFPFTRAYELLRRKAAPAARRRLPSAGSSSPENNSRKANSMTALSLIRSRKAKLRKRSATSAANVCDTVAIFSDFLADAEDASALNAEAPLESGAPLEPGAPFDADPPSVDDDDPVGMVRERLEGGATQL